MTSTTKKCLIIIGCVALILLPLTPSSADVLTYTATTPLTAASFSNDFTLPAFDSNAGTLDSITFGFGIPISGSVEADNTTGSPSGFGGDLVVYNTFSGSPEGLGEVTGVAGVGGGLPGDFSNSFSGTGNATGIAPIPAGAFASWEEAGGGTLDFTLDASTVNFEGGGPGINFSDAIASESGAFSVTYTYAASPEPSTYAMMLGGLALLVLSKALRFAKSSRMTT
jgi:hypothetical protein